jgi:hypothetical protein
MSLAHPQQPAPAATASVFAAAPQQPPETWASAAVPQQGLATWIAMVDGLPQQASVVCRAAPSVRASAVPTVVSSVLLVIPLLLS